MYLTAFQKLTYLNSILCMFILIELGLVGLGFPY